MGLEAKGNLSQGKPVHKFSNGAEKARAKGIASGSVVASSATVLHKLGNVGVMSACSSVLQVKIILFCVRIRTF